MLVYAQRHAFPWHSVYNNFGGNLVWVLFPHWNMKKTKKKKKQEFTMSPYEFFLHRFVSEISDRVLVTCSTYLQRYKSTVILDIYLLVQLHYVALSTRKKFSKWWKTLLRYIRPRKKMFCFRFHHQFAIGSVGRPHFFFLSFFIFSSQITVDESKNFF